MNHPTLHIALAGAVIAIALTGCGDNAHRNTYVDTSNLPVAASTGQSQDRITAPGVVVPTSLYNPADDAVVQPIVTAICAGGNLVYEHAMATTTDELYGQILIRVSAQCPSVADAPVVP